MRAIICFLALSTVAPTYGTTTLASHCARVLQRVNQNQVHRDRAAALDLVQKLWKGVQETAASPALRSSFVRPGRYALRLFESGDWQHIGGTARAELWQQWGTLVADLEHPDRSQLEVFGPIFLRKNDLKQSLFANPSDPNAFARWNARANLRRRVRNTAMGVFTLAAVSAIGLGLAGEGRSAVLAQVGASFAFVASGYTWAYGHDFYQAAVAGRRRLFGTESFVQLDSLTGERSGRWAEAPAIWSQDIERWEAFRQSFSTGGVTKPRWFHIGAAQPKGPVGRGPHELFDLFLLEMEEAPAWMSVVAIRRTTP